MNTHQAAYGIYPREAALPDIVHTLNRAGFSNEDICMVLSPAHPISSIVRHANIFNEDCDDGVTSARMIGWFSEFGAVVIPTIGFFIRSQAYLRALMTEQNSSSVCGGSGTLAGLCFSEGDAEKLEDQLGELGALVYVSCQESARAQWATELLRHTGAREASQLHQEKALSAAA
jgi:hypothetical protein